MRRFIFAMVFTALSACGGGGGGSGSTGGGTTAAGGGASGDGRLPPAIPTVAISGAAVDGLIVQGTIRAYNFTNGVRGAVLGSTKTDSAGHYSLSIQVESMPILLEVTGGYYKEEADGKNVYLGSSDILTAVTNFQTGTPVTMAVTPWTHVAAGLAAYNIKNGVGVSDAITAANSAISQIVGVDITQVIPADVTDPANIVGAMTDAVHYGWMSAAISQWTFDQLSGSSNLQHVDPYTSIKFAQALYQDALFDGLLDGIGATGQLTFSTTNLGVGIYRDALSESMLKFVGNINNQTQLTSQKVLAAASSFRQATGPVFGQTAVSDFKNPVVGAISTGTAFLQGASSSVSASVSDPTGVYSVVMKVDGKVVATNSEGGNSVSATFNYDTTSLSDGIHKVAFTVMNGAGKTLTIEQNMTVDNTPPYFLVLGTSDFQAAVTHWLPSITDQNDPRNPMVFGLMDDLYTLPGDTTPVSIYASGRPDTPPTGCIFGGYVTDTTSGMGSVKVELFLQNSNHTLAAQTVLPFGESDVSTTVAPLMFPSGDLGNTRFYNAQTSYIPARTWWWGANLRLMPSMPRPLTTVHYDAKLTLKDKAGNALVLDTTQSINYGPLNTPAPLFYLHCGQANTDQEYPLRAL